MSEPKGRGFAIGDVVRLKAGGPAMTVREQVGHSVECVWFVPPGELVQGAFNRDEVETSTPDVWLPKSPGAS